MSSLTSNSANSVVEDAILCPILQTPIRDPVEGNDRQIYERSAILKWLSKKQTSPVTREPMTVNDLKPANSAICYLCDKYHSGKMGKSQVQSKSKILNNCQYSINDKAQIDKNTNELHLSLFTEGDEEFDIKDAPPVDIVVVIDRSGSTGSPVESQDSTGSKQEVGYSIRDILVHGAKTIVSSMRPCDRICIVSFDDRVEVVIPLQNMTPVKRSGACSTIEHAIKPRGSTNIYGGITKAIDIIEERDDKTRSASIMMLTDGQPNISPARGEVHALKNLQQKTGFSVPIYTFGFGYNLKRGLLYELAKVANASTGHIPDGGMVATVFSNYLAMILSTACVNVELTFKITSNNSNFKFNKNNIIGDFPVTINENNTEMIVRGGTVQFQQSRDFVFNFDLNADIEFNYSYEIGGKKFNSNFKNISNVTSIEESGKKNCDYQKLRLQASQNLREAIYVKSVVPDQDSAVDLYNSLVRNIEATQHPKAVALLKTIKEQVYLILGSQKHEHSNYYRKWGEFYLDLLSSALLRQHTPNFKDEACMVFGGKCFKNFVDHIADTFDSLPPPKPSLKIYDAVTRSYQQGSGVASMRSYNDANGGCWTGDCLITMADGSKKRSDQIEPGDVIKTLSDFRNGNMFKTTTVLKIMKTILPSKKCFVVNFPGIMRGGITQWHPIQHKGKIVFPNEIGEIYEKDCDSLFNFVLSDTHFAIVNDTPCITLGHSYTNGILKHPYFGSKQVVKDLSKLDGFKEGIIVVYLDWFRRGGDELGRGRQTINKISPTV